jgi:hypothetical protein
MALDVYLYWELSLGPSARGMYDAVPLFMNQDRGCNGTTRDKVYLPKPLRADRHGVHDK